MKLEKQKITILNILHYEKKNFKRSYLNEKFETNQPLTNYGAGFSSELIVLIPLNELNAFDKLKIVSIEYNIFSVTFLSIKISYKNKK